MLNNTEELAMVQDLLVAKGYKLISTKEVDTHNYEPKNEFQRIFGRKIIEEDMSELIYKKGFGQIKIKYSTGRAIVSIDVLRRDGHIWKQTFTKTAIGGSKTNQESVITKIVDDAVWDCEHEASKRGYVSHC